MNQKVLIATVTNLAYGLAGWALIDHLNVAIACFILMVGSGIHHYYMEDWSRKFDYFGMYVVIMAMIASYFGFAWIYGLIGALGVSLLALVAFGSSRAIVGGGMGLVALLLIATNVALALEALTVLAIAFTFNYLFDGPLDSHHDIGHGMAWHIPSAYAIYLSTLILL